MTGAIHVALRSLAVTIAALAVLVPQAQAAFPGRNGALLVAGAPAGTHGESCPAGPPQVVGHVADDAFYCSSGRYAWLAGPVGQGVRRLWRAGDAEDAFDAYAGGFSPDGRRVVLGIKAGAAELVLGPARGGGRLRVTALRGSSPAWMADGGISFTGRDDAFYVARGGKPRRRSDMPSGVVRWSSTGRWAVAGYGAELQVSDRNGRQIAAYGPSGADQFDWAPDGRSLVVARTIKGKGRALYAVSKDGVVRSRVTAFVPKDSDQLQDPLWSPDGRLIAFRSGTRVMVTSARARDPQGPSAWRTVMRGCEALIDWQALPTGTTRPWFTG